MKGQRCGKKVSVMKEYMPHILSLLPAMRFKNSTFLSCKIAKSERGLGDQPGEYSSKFTRLTFFVGFQGS